MKLANLRLPLLFLITALVALPGLARARPASGLMTPQGAGGPFQYLPGTLYRYQWDSGVTGTTYSEGKDGLGYSQARYELHSNVDVRAIDPIDGYPPLMEVRLEKPQILYQDESGQLVEAPLDPDLLNQLLLPIYFEQLPDGTIGRVLAQKEDGSTSLNLKRSIASSFQVSLASGDRSERDVSGEYVAHYTVTGPEGPMLITRDRTQDDFKRFADPNFDLTEFALTDHTEITLDPEGVLLSAKVTGNLLSSTGGRYGDEGYSVWNTADSSGALASLGVTQDPFGKPDLSSFVDVDILGTPTADELPPDEGAQAAAMGSLGLLQQSPGDPAVFNHTVASLRQSPGAVEQVGVLLGQRAVESSFRGALINALAAVGTPAAQHILVQQLRRGGDTAEWALMAVAFISRPTPEVVEAVEQVFTNGRSPLHRQSALVLGTLAKNLQRTQPFRVAVIAQRLEGSLASARDEASISLYLSALGNAGTNVSADAILPFLSHPSAEVRLDAVDALRNHPVEAVSGPLQAIAALDREPVVREAAQESLAAMTGQSGFAPTTLYSWSWSRWLGGRDLGANFTANASVNTDNPNNITLQGQGEAIGWAFQHSYSLVYARAYSDVVNQGGVLRRHFNAQVKVLGSTVVNGDQYVNCGNSSTGTLYSVTRPLFSLSYTFYVAGVLPITLSLSASGTVSVPYEYRWNACNAPVYVSASARVTPTAYVSATGGITISLWVIRGGASVTADLLRTGVPVYAEGHINYGTAGACLNVSMTEQAISGGVDLWYQWRTWWGGWGTRHSWRVWSFGSPATSTTLYNHCW